MTDNTNPIKRVVHCKQESYDVYIGRPSKWGNPYSHIPGKGILCNSREEAIQKYREYIEEGAGCYLLKELHELKGKVLGCWCKSKSGPQKACHGDVLVELVDKYCNNDTNNKYNNK